MSTKEAGGQTWHTLAPRMPYVLLSAVDPPDARKPGPVVGPGSRVRRCESRGPTQTHDIVCLEVDAGDGPPIRGYTSLPVDFFPRTRRRPFVRVATAGGLVALVGIVAALI